MFPALHLLQEASHHSNIHLGSMVPLFILMVMKGKSVKEEYG